MTIFQKVGNLTGVRPPGRSGPASTGRTRSASICPAPASTELAPACGRDGRALLKAVYAAAGSDPDLAFLARLQQAGVLRAVLVQNYLTVTGEQGREVIKRREAQVEGLPPGRSRITSPCDTDARRGAGAGRQGGATDPATKPSRRRDPSAGRLGRVFPGLPHVSLVGAGPEASRWS